MRMDVRWLGWAGFELTVAGRTILIDPLADPSAVFAALGEEAKAIADPAVVPPSSPGQAAAALLSHLHRDHADAGALASGLAAGAPVLEPRAGTGEGLEELGLAQADHELNAAGLERRRLAEWESAELGPFTVTAVPAADGTGDPQLSWLVEGAGVRVLHLGDTLFHGYWWRIAMRAGPIDLALVPINGAVLDFPHRRPASSYPGVMDPEQAAEAVRLLGARSAVPMHFGGYGGSRFYRPADRPLERFLAAAEDADWQPRRLETGERIEVAAAA